MAMTGADDQGGARPEPPPPPGGAFEALLRLTLIERIALGVACLCTVMIGVLSFLDIVFRTARIEFHLAGEGSTIMLAWLLFLVLPAATRRRQHISLTFIEHWAGPRTRKAIRLFGHLVMLVYMAVLGWFLWRLAMNSIAQDLRTASILRLPQIYAQSGVVLGTGLLLITQVHMLIADALTPAELGQGPSGGEHAGQTDTGVGR